MLRKDKPLRNKIRGVFVALNKRDLVRRKTDYAGRRKKVGECLVHGLGHVLGRQAAKSIPILPTIAVQTKHGTRMVDALIRTIAKQVTK